MLCEKELLREYKRVPGLLKEAIKEKDVELIVDLMYYKRFLDWVLNAFCECKKEN